MSEVEYLQKVPSFPDPVFVGSAPLLLPIIIFSEDSTSSIIITRIIIFVIILTSVSLTNSNLLGRIALDGNLFDICNILVVGIDSHQ